MRGGRVSATAPSPFTGVFTSPFAAAIVRPVPVPGQEAGPLKEFGGLGDLRGPFGSVELEPFAGQTLRGEMTVQFGFQLRVCRLVLPPHL